MLKRLFIVFVAVVSLNTSALASGKQEDFSHIDELLLTTPHDSVVFVMNVWHQMLSFKYPNEWGINPVFKKQKGGYFIIEYIPKNQSPESWKDMLSIQGFNDLAKQENFSPDTMMTILRNRFASLAPDQMYFKEIYRGDVGGYAGLIVLMGLKEMPSGLNPTLPKGNGELSLYLFLKGSDDIYIVHRSWKTAKPYSEQRLPMSQQELDMWVGLLKQVKLMSADEFSQKVRGFEKVEFKGKK
jgi:hypothetical protein